MATENELLKSDFWQEHVISWKSSGMTQLAYCKKHDLNYPSFVYQNNRFNRQAKKSTVHFSEAKVVQKEELSQGATLQLMLPNGVRVGIGQRVQASLLEMVLSIAGRLSC